MICASHQQRARCLFNEASAGGTLGFLISLDSLSQTPSTCGDLSPSASVNTYGCRRHHLANNGLDNIIKRKRTSLSGNPYIKHHLQQQTHEFFVQIIQIVAGDCSGDFDRFLDGCRARSFRNPTRGTRKTACLRRARAFLNPEGDIGEGSIARIRVQEGVQSLLCCLMLRSGPTISAPHPPDWPAQRVALQLHTP